MPPILAMALMAAPAVGAEASGDPCQIESPSNPANPEAGKRLLSTRDLATLADIGRSDPYASSTPLGVSPDGTKVAFIERRANPDTNSYCQRLLVVPMSGGAARELDRGGEFMRASMSLWRLAALQAGFTAVVPPRWSHDGQSVAFLKRLQGSTQLWAVNTVSGQVNQITDLAGDIEDFRWAQNDRSFILSHRPGLLSAQKDIEREGRSGWLFDERFSPMQQHRPFPLEPIPREFIRFDPTTGTFEPATAEEAALIDPQHDSARPTQARLFAKNEHGDRIWTDKSSGDVSPDNRTLVMAMASGKRAECTGMPCARAVDIWWSPDGKDAWIQTREGWGNSQFALYRWQRDTLRPRLVLRTDDALVGCAPAGQSLLCGREGAVTPRRIVAINMHSGAQQVVYDPNPEFHSLRLGSVRRFLFRNAYDVECYADLVLPPGHKPGQKHPLVLVQYVSDGFLRGGTGDEVPIQALAAEGFAVLSFARPNFIEASRRATSEVELRQMNRVGWVDRRSVQSALEIAIGLAVKSGSVDERHMGISGLSDGASTAQWALINSSLFAAAALGSCCEDRLTLPLNGGPGYEAYLREMIYPDFDVEDRAFWAPLSLAQNIDDIRTPILIQTADTEYAMGLDVISAFRARGKALEVRIFPDEVHIKWQPAHRLAMYDRVVAWFRFWLKGEIDCAPTNYANSQHWLAMMDADSRENVRCMPPRQP